MIFRKPKRLIVALGGKSQKPPVPVLTPPEGKNVKRSTQSLEVIDLLCEGPIAGLVNESGSVVSGLDLAKGIYLNDTPVISKDSTFNFRQLSAELKHGYLDSPTFADNGFNETELTVDIQKKLTGPWSWSDPTVSANFHQDLSSHDYRQYSGNELDYGQWTNTVDEEHFPEEEAFVHTHTIHNKDVTDAIVNLRIEKLQDTYHVGDGGGKVGKLGNPKNTTLKLRIVYGYFDSDDDNNKVELGTTNITYDATITQTAYGVSHEISFPEEANGKKKFLDVSKQSYETLSPLVSREVTLDGVVEVMRQPILTMPCSAVMGMRMDARTFSNLPQRTYDCKLKIIRIPSNYYPDNRTESASDAVYDGVWDGSFKWGWSDNPAWVLYDLLINNVYGVGDFVDPNFADKWTLYEIGRYCDAVDDEGDFEGINGKPRFRCNMLINGSRDAFDFINEVAAMFRGLVYWYNGGLHFVDDRPKDYVMTFTNQDVENGEFDYSETTKNTRFNIAEIQYNDEDDNFKPKVESIEDKEGLSKHGPLIQRVEGVGVTSREEASRLGKYILYTSKLETNSVQFTSGPKCVYLRPGDVFAISDRLKTVTKSNGQILNIGSGDSQFTLTVDNEPPSGANTMIMSWPYGHYTTGDIEDLNYTGSQPEAIRAMRSSQYAKFNIADLTISLAGTGVGGNVYSMGIAPSSTAISKIELLQCNAPVEYTLSPPITGFSDDNPTLTYDQIVSGVSGQLGIVIDYSGTGQFGQTAEMPTTDIDKIGFTSFETQVVNELSTPDYIDLALIDNKNVSYMVTGSGIEEPEYFKVINIAEDNKNAYQVIGSQYNPDKYSAIESGYVSTASTTSDINSINFQASRPTAPTAFEIDLREDIITGTVLNATWDWEGSLDSISKFLVGVYMPDGDLITFDVLPSDYASYTPPTYSYNLDLTENIPDGEYGSYQTFLQAVGASPYYTPSTQQQTTGYLDVTAALLYDDTVISNMDLANGFNETYTTGVSGLGSGQVYGSDANVSWNLIDRTGFSITNQSEFSQNVFRINQRVDILSGNGGDASYGEEVDYGSLNYTLSKARNTAIFGQAERSFGIRVVATDNKTGLYTGTYFVNNTAPTISSLDVIDAHDNISGQVKLNFGFDNSGDFDLARVVVYTGDSASFIPDTTNNTNKIYDLPVPSSATTGTLSLDLYDGQSSGDTSADYLFPYEGGGDTTYPSGYLWYKALPFDSYGSGYMFDSPRSGILLPSNSYNLEPEDYYNWAVSGNEELKTCVRTTGDQSVNGTKTFYGDVNAYLGLTSYGSLVAAGTSPTGSAADGTQGQIARGTDGGLPYLYVCTGINAWGRVQLQSW